MMDVDGNSGHGGLVLDIGNSTIEWENEDFLSSCDLDPHDYLEVKFIMISVVGTLIGLFGLFGNFSTVVILTRPNMRSPNNMFLTALAIYDSCLLLTAFCIYGMEYIIEYFRAINLYIAWLTYLRFAFALSHISQTGSVYTTLSVTVENFLAVCYPRISKRFCTRKVSAVTILGITCFAILFNATRFFELEVFRNPECADLQINWQSYVLLPSDLARNPLYGQIFTLWLTNLIMVFIPFLTLLILNFVIAYTIRKSLKLVSEQKRTRISELREKSREASIVLVVIVLIFLICNFWGFVLTLLEQIVGIEYLMTQHKAFYTFSRETINFLAIINSSINFVIYIIFGKDFRKELIVIYGCGMKSRLSLPMPTHSKLSTWRQMSSRRFSAFKTPVLANGMRLLKMTTLARGIASFNGGIRRSSNCSRKASTSSNLSCNDDEFEQQELIDTTTSLQTPTASVGRKYGKTSITSNGFLTVPSLFQDTQPITNHFDFHRDSCDDSSTDSVSSTGIHFV